MAVVQKSAAALPDLDSAKPKPADVRINHGVLRTSCFVAEVTNGDNAGSTYEVARLPSHARIHKLSQIHSSGITGATDVDLGLADDGAPDVLMDGGTLAGTQSYSAATTPGNATLTDPLWKLAGLEKDPKREMSVKLTLNTAATADGTAVADLIYIVD